MKIFLSLACAAAVALGAAGCARDDAGNIVHTPPVAAPVPAKAAPAKSSFYNPGLPTATMGQSGTATTPTTAPSRPNKDD
ncbi:MAG: hypothetical protein HYX47_00305 [Burkholderiales bacterium]|nr:hypothetical protein [Burkholderiales bacterium]